jgi:hypothetical protein
MFYQLPNGRVLEISTEQYFLMSDEELDYLLAYNYGDIVENPWHGSILTKHCKTLEDNPEIMRELTDIPGIDKLLDLDIEIEEE